MNQMAAASNLPRMRARCLRRDVIALSVMHALVGCSASSTTEVAHDAAASEARALDSGAPERMLDAAGDATMGRLSQVDAAPDGDASGAFDGGPCVDGASCVPSDPCHIGFLWCGGGAPVCYDTQAPADGVACGGSKICIAGVCSSCRNDYPCTPANACHRGRISCAGTTPSCIDQGTPGNDGAACAPGSVCHNGTCGGPCAAIGSPCAKGGDCCSSQCTPGNQTCACAGTGAGCSSNDDCCTRVCTHLRCACGPKGATCQTASECCEGNCVNNQCACGSVGQACLSADGCCSKNCVSGQCACSPGGGDCTRDGDCCMGKSCRAGQCL